MNDTATYGRSTRVVAWLLAISYGVGAPLMAILEHGSQLFSQRFDLPPELIYLTCVVQFACAIGVLVRPLAAWAAAGLTVTTLGAVASHLRIHSPTSAGPALAYTVLQAWFWYRTRAAGEPRRQPKSESLG
ncbi:MAG: DoxX family protein [Candidatus Palauibacterales bacterium]|nr:DoxX family protein [Candidatus Palauibacterales bacterium]MDP2528395.1 DoxX family protein [Candidatus Palauibacterales bacterium]MDP2584981.1 DoxX family protein [Candidatus Palauibacterales bacterium]